MKKMTLEIALEVIQTERKMGFLMKEYSESSYWGAVVILANGFIEGAKAVEDARASQNKGAADAPSI